MTAHEDTAADRALGDLVEQLELVVETARLGTWVLDCATDVVELNGRQLQIYGVPGTHRTARLDQWRRQVHPDDHDVAEEALALARAGETVSGVRFRIVRPDGEVRFLDAAAAPATDGTGAVRRIIGVSLDVTERQLAEAKLRESEARYRTLFELTHDGVVVAEAATGRFLFVNPALCDLLGYDEPELLRMTLPELHRGDRREGPSIGGGGLPSDSLDEAAEFPFVHRSGRLVYVALSSQVMALDGRDCVVAFLRDVTDRRLLSALREKTDELARFNDAMLGREARIIELKEEVNRLAAAQGLPSPYPAVWTTDSIPTLDEAELRPHLAEPRP